MHLVVVVWLPFASLQCTLISDYPFLLISRFFVSVFSPCLPPITVTNNCHTTITITISPSEHTAVLSVAEGRRPTAAVAYLPEDCRFRVRPLSQGRRHGGHALRLANVHGS